MATAKLLRCTCGKTFRLMRFGNTHATADQLFALHKMLQGKGHTLQK